MPAALMQGDDMIERLRVEPISGYLERRRKGPIYPVTVANGFVSVGPAVLRSRKR